MSGAFKSLLLGSKIRILLTAVIAVGIVVAGSVSLGVLGAPSVGDVENRFGNVTAETTEIRTDLVVRNPNPFGVKLGGVSVSYDVTLNDVRLANGTKEGVTIERGNGTVSLRSTVRNERIPAWWVSHVRNGERTDVRVDASVRSETLGRSFSAPPVEREISTDVISQFNSTETRPVNASQPLVSDPVAYVNETSAQWGEVTNAESPIDMHFVVYNPKATPLAVTEIGYNITMNDVRVGNGTTDREHVVEGHSSETIDAQTAIRNQRLDEWWVTHLRNDQVTNLTIDFYAKVEFAGETFTVPLRELTYEKTIETDIFGNKNASAGNAAATTSGSETETTGGKRTATTDDDSATTAVGSTTTESESATTDESTTTDGGSSDEGTTTDDGLLGRDPDIARSAR